MPCSLLTIHAYRSWMPDHRRGYTQHGRIRPRDVARAERFERSARDGPFEFDAEVLTFPHGATVDIAARRGWRVHAVFGEPTHLHLVISWSDATRPMKLRLTIANVLSTLLGRWRDEPGRRWFARRPSFVPVRDRGHFDHLVGAYRRKHLLYRWCEGDSPPPALGTFFQ